MSSEDALRRLRRYFLRNGCTRSVNEKRREADGYRNYKKGYEIRFVARYDFELEEIQRALDAAGYRPGKAWRKVGRTVVPVYGKEQTARLLDEMEKAASG